MAAVVSLFQWRIQLNVQPCIAFYCCVSLPNCGVAGESLPQCEFLRGSEVSPLSTFGTTAATLDPRLMHGTDFGNVDVEGFATRDMWETDDGKKGLCAI